MKRSNLFLGLTTGLLAVASFAFAKSHKGAITQAKCATKIVTPGVTACHLVVTAQRYIQQAAGDQCLTAGGNLGTFRTFTACQLNLKVNPA